MKVDLLRGEIALKNDHLPVTDYEQVKPITNL